MKQKLYSFQSGFSLLDPFLFVLLALVLAGVLLPWYRSDQVAKNESDALQGLREMQPQIQGLEKGQAFSMRALLNESNSGKSSSKRDGLEFLDDFTVQCKGYLYRCFQNDEEHRIYAWPLKYGRSGNACYSLSSGELLECRNERRQYSGLERTPNLKASSLALERDKRRYGRDGQEWYPAALLPEPVHDQK